MKLIHLFSTIALCAVPALASAGSMEAEIKTHPATGSVDAVNGAKACWSHRRMELLASSPRVI